MTTVDTATFLQDRLRLDKVRAYVPHKPSTKQIAFLASNHLREVFYGGAAGGGKSDALLLGALQYVDIPGYNAILFRRTFADLKLPEALMSRAHEWLDRTDAHWSQPTWTFPSGATLSFGYLDHERQVYRYQSAAFQYIGFDELPHFTEFQYRYLFSRLRRLEGTNIPLRMRSAGNPDGPGVEWVKQRFITTMNLAPPLRPTDRLFIPAKLADNPYVDQEAYIESLMHLDPVTRKRLLEGDWDAIAEGALFNREWFKDRFLDKRPKIARQVRYWDFAATPKTPATDPDWTVGLLLGETEERDIVILDIRRVRLSAQRVEVLLKHTAQQDGVRTPVAFEQEPGSAGEYLFNHLRRDVLRGWTVIGDRPTGSKVERAKPVAARAEPGDVYIVSDGSFSVPAFLDELVGFPYLDHDDQVDALSGAYKALTRGSIINSLGMA